MAVPSRTEASNAAQQSTAALWYVLCTVGRASWHQVGVLLHRRDYCTRQHTKYICAPLTAIATRWSVVVTTLLCAGGPAPSTSSYQHQLPALNSQSRLRRSAGQPACSSFVAKTMANAGGSSHPISERKDSDHRWWRDMAGLTHSYGSCPSGVRGHNSKRRS